MQVSTIGKKNIYLDSTDYINQERSWEAHM